jgi:YegS/Rv2252/BmrU family lipid kinase
VLLVVNPVSGAVDKSGFIDATTDFASKKNRNLILYKTTGGDDISKIRQLYESLNPERIIIVGGDGTIKMVAEAIENNDVILGILPAGSANGLAVDLDLMRTLDENLDIAFHNHYIELDSIIINNQRCFHLSDLGLNAELVKNYEKNNIRGKWGYFLQSINALMDFGDPFTATIIANDQTIECEARMIVIANSQKYGTGVTINPNGSMNDGKFELIILKSLDIVLLGKIITGNMPIDSDDIVIISTENALIKTDRLVNFQIDGEYCGAQNDLEIHILHKQMKIAVP